MFFRRLLLTIIVLLAIFTRFWKIDWGEGLFFQPDENNMATAITQFRGNNLNPHFFAYGQFPLYLGYFSLKVVGLPNNFPNSIYILRFYSAIFSVISVLLFYKIINQFSTNTTALIGGFLFVFTPGLIQLAHFGTTESLLILVFLANIYYSLRLFKKPLSLLSYFFVALSSGIGLGAKISSLVFMGPLFLVSFINFFIVKDKLKITFLVTYTVLLSLLIFIAASPYNLIENKHFLSAMNYETQVARGSMKVFYTNQFLGSLPYLFQLKNIFPYAAGIPLVVMSMLGIIFVKKSREIFVIAFSCLIYFIYFGQLYVKWTRFMSPLFFLLPLLSAFAIAKFRSRFLQVILVFICCIPGIYFMNLYLKPDIRLAASLWINSSLPEKSKVLSEGGNVLDIPFGNHQLNIANFDFYTLENNPENIDRLVSLVSEADYILVPSRRVFKNQKGELFPVSSRYYQALFDGSLGFSEIKHFSPATDIYLNPENAEETWTVFDRPDIRIYKKVNNLEPSSYEAIIKG